VSEVELKESTRIELSICHARLECVYEHNALRVKSSNYFRLGSICVVTFGQLSPDSRTPT
jgi:hypothetical protein